MQVVRRLLTDVAYSRRVVMEGLTSWHIVAETLAVVSCVAVALLRRLCIVARLVRSGSREVQNSLQSIDARVSCHIIHARAKSADVIENREEQPFKCSADVVNSRVRLSKFFHYFVKVMENLHLSGGSPNGGLGIGCRRYIHNCVVAKSSKPSIIWRDIGQSPGDIGGVNVIRFLNIWWHDEGLGIPVLTLGVDPGTLTIIVGEVVEWVGGSHLSRGSRSNGLPLWGNIPPSHYITVRFLRRTLHRVIRAMRGCGGGGTGPVDCRRGSRRRWIGHPPSRRKSECGA
jgi:hypothetical protein